MESLRPPSYHQAKIEAELPDALDKKTDIKLTFTVAERTEIRDALLRYATERDIGVPTLYYEVIQHDPLRRDMSMRTLQRYMANANKTQDQNVSICHEFVKSLPDFSEERGIEQLGNTLIAFASGTPTTESDWLQWDRVKLDIRYSSDMNTGEGLSLVKKGASFDDLMPYSTMIMEREPDDAFFRTFETIENPFPASPSSGPIRFQTEGIAVPVEDRYMLWVARDNLTRRPRTTIWTRRRETNSAGAYVLSITPQYPEADEETSYVPPVRLFAALVGNQAKDGEGEKEE